MYNLTSNGSTPNRSIKAGEFACVVSGEFGGGSVAVEVSYDDGVTFVPIERTEGALVPIAITVPLVANAIVFGKPLIRFTLTGATAPDLNLGFHS